MHHYIVTSNERHRETDEPGTEGETIQKKHSIAGEDEENERRSKKRGSQGPDCGEHVRKKPNM